MQLSAQSQVKVNKPASSKELPVSTSKSAGARWVPDLSNPANREAILRCATVELQKKYPDLAGPNSGCQIQMTLLSNGQGVVVTVEPAIARSPLTVVVVIDGLRIKRALGYQI